VPLAYYMDCYLPPPRSYPAPPTTK
jgi:hypothetical protein